VRFSDIDYNITVIVRRSDNSGSITSAPTPTITIGTVSIAGTAQVGQTLMADTRDIDGSGTISYQWRRNQNNISDATSNIYIVQTSDIGAFIDVVVTSSGSSVISAPIGSVIQ
jgi:hypothetical protein